MEIVTRLWWIIPIILAAIFHKQLLRIGGVVMIAEDAIGIINKKFAKAIYDDSNRNHET